MSMTPMNNFDYLERVKFSEELAEIEAAKKASGMTYEQLAEKIGVKSGLQVLLKDNNTFLKSTA